MASGAATTAPVQQSSQIIPSSTKPLVAGFVAGVASTLFLTPLDVVKVRLQVMESAKPDAKFRFFRIFGGILKYEGAIGLYAGLTPAVIGSAVSWGGYFFFYEQLKNGLADWKRSTTREEDPTNRRDVSTTGKQQQQQQQEQHRPPAHPSQVLNSFDNFVLACASGIIMVPLTNPIWLIKTRMQLQMRNAEIASGVKPYRNMWDAARTIVRDESFAALYKGSGAAILLTSHGGVQFVVYEYLRKHFHCQRLSREESDGLNVWRRLELSAGYLAMGGIAKLVATTVTYPLQVIKARIQQRSESIELTDDGRIRAVKRNYADIVSTVGRIYEKEGLAGFMKGCFANAFRVAPAAAVTFLVYEEVSDFLGR